LLYYWEEWIRMFDNVKRMREEAGKRMPPKTPPIPLPVRFVMPNGAARGNKHAPAVIDLRRGELRIPSHGIVEKLPRSLVRVLIEENELNPRPEFVLMLTRRGLLRLIASRSLPAPPIAPPIRVIAIDENSAYGFSIVA
jgi:hypothetical protein